MTAKGRQQEVMGVDVVDGEWPTVGSRSQRRSNHCRNAETDPLTSVAGEPTDCVVADRCLVDRPQRREETEKTEHHSDVRLVGDIGFVHSPEVTAAPRAAQLRESLFHVDGHV